MSFLTIDNFTIPDKIVILNKGSYGGIGEYCNQKLQLKIVQPINLHNRKAFQFSFYWDSEWQFKENKLTFYHLYPDEIKQMSYITWEQFDRLKAFV